MPVSADYLAQLFGLEGDVAFTVHEAARMKVLKLIPNGKQEIAQRDILRSVRMPVRDLQAILEALRAEEMIVSRSERSAGPTKVLWRRV